MYVQAHNQFLHRWTRQILSVKERGRQTERGTETGRNREHKRERTDRQEGGSKWDREQTDRECVCVLVCCVAVCHTRMHLEFMIVNVYFYVMYSVHVCFWSHLFYMSNIPRYIYNNTNRSNSSNDHFTKNQSFILSRPLNACFCLG